MQISERQIELVNKQIDALVNAGSFYGKKLKEAGISGIKDQADFEALPFSEKSDLREAYPLGLMTAPEEDIVRIHSSSGTTGLPVIIPYTAKDVDDWAIMFARCYEFAGITKKDRIQITPGYGLWTAGIGFQNGAEKLLGHGDMLYLDGMNNRKPQRLQGGLITDSEICNVVMDLRFNNQHDFTNDELADFGLDILQYYGR